MRRRFIPQAFDASAPTADFLDFVEDEERAGGRSGFALREGVERVFCRVSPVISSIVKKGTVPPKEAWTIARRLGQHMRPNAVYLFGSHARGDAGTDSDLDILVVVPDSSQPRYARSIEARRFVSDIPVPKDIVVLTQREWEEERNVVCSLASNVAREGLRLYG